LTTEVIRTYGYIKVHKPDHPFADKQEYIFEHKIVMEEYLSKIYKKRILLSPALQIHHKNRKRNDNRISNLELVTPQQHAQRHRKYIIRVCYICNSYKSYIHKKTGNELWRIHNNKHVCYKCFITLKL